MFWEGRDRVCVEKFLLSIWDRVFSREQVVIKMISDDKN